MYVAKLAASKAIPVVNDHGHDIDLSSTLDENLTTMVLAY